MKGVTTSNYVRRVLKEAFSERAEQTLKPKKSAYGLLARQDLDLPPKRWMRTGGRCFAAFAEDVP
jgi:hypothetical protein